MSASGGCKHHNSKKTRKCDPDKTKGWKKKALAKGREREGMEKGEEKKIRTEGNVGTHNLNVTVF